MLTTTLRKFAITAAALGSLGLGGAAVAGAASKAKTSSSGTSTSQTRQGRHHDDALASDVAAKVKAAALDKVPGATVLRAEAGGPDNSAYHAHIRTSDGKLQVVLVDSSFQATAVQDDQSRGDGDGRHGGRGHGGRDETALTGDTKSSVEAAVLARYAGATIVRTETNGDGDAPYESHITTSAGQELEVLVSKDFQVVDAQTHSAHP